MLPDNRIRYPASLVDFETDVGLTGQDHDNYPASGVQLRYDHMRLTLLGLLANQSSYDEPVEFREGTLWMDLTSNALKIRRNGAWANLSEALIVAGLSLTEWAAGVDAAISSSQPNATFSGVASQNTTTLAIPTSLQAMAGRANIRALVYIDGLLQDPRNCQILSGNTVKLLNSIFVPRRGRFTVILTYIPTTNFVSDDA